MFALPSNLALWRFFAVFLLLAAPGPAFADTTQASSQGTAADTNHKGSDNDIDEATSNGMQALMNLSALNIPGAFSKGYEAYGNYINSTKLDDLEAKTKKLKGTMVSVGQGPVTGTSNASTPNVADADSGVSGTMFSKKLNLTSLQSGKAAVLATEFEKRSGMSREELVQHFNGAVDAQLNYRDPDLLNKLETRFHAFRDRIPNKDFREGFVKAENLFSDPLKAKALGEVMAFYQSAVSGGKSEAKLATGDNGPAAAVPANAVAVKEDPNAAKTADAKASDAAGAVNAGAAATDPNRVIASDANSAYSGEKLGMFIGLNGNSNALKDFVQAGNLNDDEISIFQMVTTRYRRLTPKLSYYGK
ncbi:MAG: hypothetical protein ACXVBE_13800 [Bdellovibrionota bacterium]